MIDLCDSRLGTTVRASAVDDDVHFLTNIISTDPRKRETGYKPALYVSGIVAVDLIFTFPVALLAVQFTTTTSKPTQAQVWVCRNIPAQTKTTRPFHMSLVSTCSLSPPSSTIILSSPSSLSSQHLPRDMPILPLPETRDTGACQCLRIVLETMGKDRCLREVRVLGNVGKLSREYLLRENITRKDIDKLIRDVKDEIRQEKLQKEKKTSSKQTSSLISTEKPKSSTSELGSLTESTWAPEEFLDAITRHVMFCPVILPSGNIVDLSTVEKHTVAESKWGRESSDPFTGIPFTADCRPVHHTTLKDRIDRWREECGGALDSLSTPRNEVASLSTPRNEVASLSTPRNEVGSSFDITGRCVGVADRPGTSVSELILSGQAKRIRVDEDESTFTRRKRIKKFEKMHSSSTKVSAVKDTTSQLQTQFSEATSHSKQQISNSNGAITNSTLERSSVESNSSSLVDSSDLRDAVSRVERTMQLLRQHEDRLELF
ncbi:hypothetical protein ACHWQZ_G016231 [Mnemiopsis leidyi]